MRLRQTPVMLALPREIRQMTPPEEKDMIKTMFSRRIARRNGLILSLALVVPTLAVMTACGGGGSGSSATSTVSAAPAPDVAFSPSSLSFSSQQAGTRSAAQAITLTNSGTATLTISSISITGADPGDFAETNTCGSSVNASANCTITVTFTPTASGSPTASVSVADNAVGSPQTVSLTGTGAGAPASNGQISPVFFGMTPAFYTNFPYANLWPTVTVGSMAKVPSTQWSGIEKTPGVYTWTNLDSAIQMAHSNGVNSIIYTIFGVPTFYASDPSSCNDGCAGPPTNMQAFSNFITALATRYKGQITYYETWNEGNRPTSWSGSTAQLVTLSQTISQVIKPIDPNAKVLGPSPDIASTFANFVQGFLSAGGLSNVDGVAWHAYRCQDGLPSGVTCLQGTSCDNNALDCAGAPLVAQIEAVKAAAQAAGASSLPIYDTEGGWGENQYLSDLNDQVAYISRWYIIQASEGVVTACWFGWGGDPSDPTAWGSIFDANTNQSTEAAAAYETTYHWLEGATMNGPCSADSDNIWTCALTFSNKHTGLIVWNGDETNSTYTPASKYVQYETLTSSSPASVAAGGSVTIGEAPILLETGSRP
jgi:FlaG/FlaF family flagellin (archaellin)